MSLSVTEMQYGKRIQADGEILFVERSEWERVRDERDRITAELEILTKQLNERMGLIRNAHKLGLVGKDGTLDYDKFVIYDSVNRGMSLVDTKKRVFESSPHKDEKVITLEYNRYTVKRGVRAGWSDSKINEYLKSMGSAIDRSVIERYVGEFSRGRQ